MAMAFPQKVFDTFPSLPLECCRFSRVAAVSCASSSVSPVDDLAPQIQHRPEDYVSALEEEIRKIQGFRRELPLCMQLLQQAISLQTGDEPRENEPGKPSWTEDCRPEVKSDSAVNCQTSIIASSKPHFYSSNKSGGAFVPFSRDTKQVVRPTPRHGTLDLKDLLATRDVDAATSLEQPIRESPPKAVAEGFSARDGSRSPGRKARRSWSPQLHRSFINALQQLGGAEAATPKQIRELMKVEGLTNDEIKSHLQKYRLHARRLGAMQSTHIHPPHVVVLGGTWTPADYTVQSSSLFDPSQKSSQFGQYMSSPQVNSSQLGSTIDNELNLHDLSCYEQKSTSARSSSLQGHMHYVDRLAMAYQPPDDNGGEESMEDCGRSGNSGMIEEDEVDDARSQDSSSDINPLPLHH